MNLRGSLMFAVQPLRSRKFLTLGGTKTGAAYYLRRACAPRRMHAQRARRGPCNRAQSDTIIVPCHRIIGSNGSLTGYAGGLNRKRALLALEAGCRNCWWWRDANVVMRC